MHDLTVSDTDIAIIGMSSRLPGSKNTHELWRNLQDGKECISQISADQLRKGLLKSLGYIPETDLAQWLNDPNYISAAAVLEDIDLFDARFFGYNSTEAALIDPQQRIFLECAWEALEDAAYDPETYRGLIGVYAGSEMNTYHHDLHASIIPSVNVISRVICNANDYLATRVSYKLNLKGPGLTIQTACSTSLVAVHVACQSLKSGECDMALAGSVVARSTQEIGYLYQEDGVLSPDGHCRPFDAQGRGTLFANGGVGVVVLKRLADALADGDNIYVVIKGSAANNDGSFKTGYTAPAIAGQVKVLLEAMAVAAVDPDSISYVETHGTATPLGDPIEVAALTQAFRTSTQRKRFCAIGSLKSNMGHLGAVAGVAGLIKTSLALKHKMLPPSLHYEQPNPQIDFANSPFYVNTKLAAWNTDAQPRRAGVSSFGMGGTNAHVILEEAPDLREARSLHDEPSTSSRQLLVLSAKTGSALEQMRVNLLDHLKNHPELNLADVAFTLQVGRKAFPHRLMLVCQTVAEAVSQLEAKRCFLSVTPPGEHPVVFMFPGQGPQYVNMGRELYEEEPTFRQQVDTCARLLVPHLHCDLRELIYPATEQGTGSPDRYKTQSLHQTDMAQPALFVIEYALAQLLMKWGVHPQAMIGHSIGEYVAACLAGVFSLEDALALVALRGCLMQALPVGAMLSVTLPEKDVQEFFGESLGESLGERLALTACNGANDSVVSGTIEAIELLEKQLMKRGIASRRLHTSHAFHSQMMDPILDPFTSAVSKIFLHPPKIPYISNLTGIWITDYEATNPAYWAQHIRQTVRFAEGIQLLLNSPTTVLLEVGPGHSLSTLAQRMVDKSETLSLPRLILPSVRHPQAPVSDMAFLLNTCGQLWCAGVAIDWSQWAGAVGTKLAPVRVPTKQRRRISLPTYPFERERYWIFPAEAARRSEEVPPLQVGKKPNIADWFSVPSWNRSPLPDIQALHEESEHEGCWLIFTDTVGLGARIEDRLQKDKEVVITVTVGAQFGIVGDGKYTLRPECREDYDALLKDLGSREIFPTHIVHLWTVIAPNHVLSGLDWFETSQALGFYSLLFLAQALGEQNPRNVGSGLAPDSTLQAPDSRACSQSLYITVISNNLQEVMEGEVLCPARATALGVGKVIPSEYPHITFRSIDIVLPVVVGHAQEAGAGTRHSPYGTLVDQIIAELRWKSSDVAVAYRGSYRWVQCIEPMRLEARGDELPGQVQRLRQTQKLRQQGVYLITGGLGGIGLALAEDLARRVRARLVLIGRTDLPAGGERNPFWDKPRGYMVDDDVTANKIRQIKMLEVLGAEVLVIKADVTDLEQMQAVIAQVRERFGELHGVIHAAGTYGGGMIQLKTPQMAASVLAPKVKGTLVLEAVLKDLQPDFLILCSSLAAIVGELGQADYCAANTFLDSFAFYHTAQQRVQTISINWDTWQEVGMAVNALTPYKKSLKYNVEAEKRLQNGILPQEGVEVFKRIINSSVISQIIVSTNDIQARLRWTESFQFPELPVTASILHQRPNLQSAYVPPRNEMEQQIAAIWQKMLGFQQIGIQDNFFEVGGDSLVGMRIMNQLSKAFEVDLSMHLLFMMPTVEGMAEVIKQKQMELRDDEQLAEVLKNVSQMSEEEALLLLEQDFSKQEIER